MLTQRDLDNTVTSPENDVLLYAPDFSADPFAPVPPIDSDNGNFGGSGGPGDACRLVVANLSAYVDNELDPDQRRLVESHLAKCAYCSEVLVALEETDTLLEREWRDCAPLPSSSGFRQAVDSIMATLPPAPAKEPAFARKRVHARLRWVRFSSGLAGALAFFSLLWSSYKIGFAHGRQSLATIFAVSPLSASNPGANMPGNATRSAAAPGASPSPQTASAAPPPSSTGYLIRTSR